MNDDARIIGVSASLILERSLVRSLVGFSHELAYRLALKDGLRGEVVRRRTVFTDLLFYPVFFFFVFISFQSLTIHDSLAVRFCYVVVDSRRERKQA